MIFGVEVLPSIRNMQKINQNLLVYTYFSEKKFGVFVPTDGRMNGRAGARMRTRTHTDRHTHAHTHHSHTHTLTRTHTHKRATRSPGPKSHARNSSGQVNLKWSPVPLRPSARVHSSAHNHVHAHTRTTHVRALTYAHRQTLSQVAFPDS